MKLNLHHVVLPLLLLGLCFSVSDADLAFEWVGGTGAVPATAPASGDLLETSLASTAGVTFVIPFDDGIVNPSNNNPGGSITWGGGADVFTFDTSVNTLGYDIDEINIYTGWNDARSGQHLIIEYTPVGGSLTSLVTFHDADDTSFTASNGSLRSSNFNLGLTGVESITITPFNNDNGSAGSVVREIDVIGSATVAVPEPASAVVLGLSGLGLMLVRRKR